MEKDASAYIPELSSGQRLPEDAVPEYLTQAQLSATYGRKGRAQIAPTVVAYEAQRQPMRTVLYQEGDTLYSVHQGGSYRIERSDDFGASWITKGTAPVGANVMAKTRKGTLIIVDRTAHSVAGQNPQIRRSTDDGVTWTAVQAIGFPPIPTQGIVETPTGTLLVCEYGTVANTVYRLWRSTDDGVTWTAVLSSPGTDPANDPGHLHSISYDPYQDRLIAFMDRPNPEIFVSADDGATFTRLGYVTKTSHPNWVMPMHFPDYIVWGSDNQYNGAIFRISRLAFYAGNFDASQEVSRVNHKAAYYAVPLRPDVWALTVAAETIALASDPLAPGSWGSEVFVVSDNGESVSSAVERLALNTVVGALDGTKATLPSFRHSAITDGLGGKTWVNVPPAEHPTRGVVSMPLTVGFAPPRQQLPLPAPGPTTRLIRQNFYYGPTGRGNGTEAKAQDTAIAVPIYVPHAARFQSLNIEVVTGGAAGTYLDLALYDNSEFDQPGAKIAQTAAVAGSTTGQKVGTFDLWLRPGLYWAVAIVRGGSPVLRTIGTGHVPPLPSTVFGSDTEPNCWVITGAAAGYPADWSSLWATGSQGVKAMLRAA